MKNRKFKIELAYLGTRFCGWQRQFRAGEEKIRSGISIQETIEAVLTQVMGTAVTVVGSGRTDAGVHATGQVAHFWCARHDISVEILFRALNGLLPRDVRVLSCAEVPPDFHAQKSAHRKQYSFYFQQGASPLPHLMDTSLWIRKPLDVQAMHAAVRHLLGEHDFRAFQASGANPGKTTIRTIFEAEVTREIHPAFPGKNLSADGFNLVRLRLVGSGFLKQMVRGIAGTLLEIGENRRDKMDLLVAMRSLERKKVGPTAPPRGLFLEKVWY